MKIAYFDLNDDGFEDYSINPKRYGGGRVFASQAKEEFNNDKDSFVIYADEKCFENLSNNERGDKCLMTTKEEREALRFGKPLKEIISNLNDIDLIVHHFSNEYLNTEGLKAKQVCWSVGWKEVVNPKFKYAIFYNDYQFPIIEETTKQYKAVIGKVMPPFGEREKEDFIFQCSRHCSSFGSFTVAEVCNRHGIPVVFAGPIEKGYPLLEKIQQSNGLKYLGQISEEEKIDYCKRARICTFLHTWPTPFNLSAIEALGCGTPIVSTGVGFWPSLVTEKNGFIVNSEIEFLNAYHKAPEIKQKDCWESVQCFSHTEMLNQFYKIFKEIVADKI